MQEKKILIIVGPTAVGKTKYAIEAAKAQNGEIISADSMQLYKFMDIGSAKPTFEERREAVHHLVDEIDPREEFSVAEYQKAAKKAINKVFEKDKIPIISGGTGLYVNSLMYDMDFASEPKNIALRQELEREMEEKGTIFLHEKLKVLDRESAERIHPNNTKKIIRALEVLEVTGKPIKSFDKSFVKTKDYDYNLIGLNRDRAKLYSRIDERVEILMKTGLVGEVEELLKKGLSEKNISMKGIGYKEIIAFLNGEYDESQAIYLIKRNSRNYAKRQLTWFKRYEDIRWFNIDDYKKRNNNENDESENNAVKEFLKWL